MFRVTPFTDIQYSGPEVAAMNSVIASCLVPTVTGVDMSSGASTGYLTGSEYARKVVGPFGPMSGKGEDNMHAIAKKMTAPNVKKWTSYNARDARNYETASGFGMCDFLMGYGALESMYTINSRANGTFSKRRKEMYTRVGDQTGGFDASRRDTDVYDQMEFEGSNLDSIAGTYPIRVEQFTDDEIAYDTIANNPHSLTLGYTMDSRNVNMMFTQTAISMIVRRLHKVVERLGPGKPIYSHVGLGHATSKARTAGKREQYDIKAPSLKWSAGNISYANKRLQAAGTLYVPQDQVPYSMMKRGFKYNHVLTLLGLELLETLQALGADFQSTGKLAGAGVNYDPTLINGTSLPAKIAALQILFTSVFGSVRGATNAADFEADPTSVADQVKEMIGMLFTSGHVHLDPGFLTYLNDAWDGNRLTGKTLKNVTYKGTFDVSAEVLMAEFISKYVVFCTACVAFRPYFQVPLYDCHWLYVGSPKPEYVIEQLQMNYRPDVVFDGSNSAPEFTLVPSRLNPGEILSRVPTLFDAKSNTPNEYLGIRDPLPYGDVTEIRFNGDKPLTTVDEREYNFTPIIEADASVNQVMRNGRVINVAVWPRPSMYVPGVSALGAVNGLMSDNAAVGGSYYFEMHNNPYFNDVNANGGTSSPPFRQVGRSKKESPQWAKKKLQGQSSSSKGAKDMQKAIDRGSIPREKNPQAASEMASPNENTGGPFLSYTGQAERGDAE